MLFVPAAVWLPLEAHWLSHVGAALSVLAAGVLLFLRGWLGAGDVKLMAAVALWTGFAYLAQFVVFVALAVWLLPKLWRGLKKLFAFLTRPFRDEPAVKPTDG